MCALALRLALLYTIADGASAALSLGRRSDNTAVQAGQDQSMFNEPATTFGLVDHRLEGRPDSSELPWHPAITLSKRNASENNLCVEGKLLPQLWLLGAAKAATTSLAVDLAGVGMEFVGRDCRSPDDKCDQPLKCDKCRAKELHWFDFAMDWGQAGTRKGLAGERAKWLNVLPSCDASDPKRRVLADFTPDSLRLVPMPETMEPHGHFNGLFEAKNFRSIDRPSPNAPPQINMPHVLSKFYGPQASELAFVVMLRDPISRTEAHYHCCICPTKKHCPGRNFYHDMQWHLNMTQVREGRPMYTDLLWYSMYSYHLEGWLAWFKARQLTIVPYKVFTEGSKDGICKELRKRLEYKMTCKSQGLQASWVGGRGITPDRTRDLENLKNSAEAQKWRADETERLVKVLERAFHEGAGLVSFKSNKNKRTGRREPDQQLFIKRWLEAWW